MDYANHEIRRHDVGVAFGATFGVGRSCAARKVADNVVVAPLQTSAKVPTVALFFCVRSISCRFLQKVGGHHVGCLQQAHES